ncbi:MAG: YciI family protein [Actinomycetota bacterium]|nr:YciI family protein [Actinomycetota bacterium]MED5221431.1 YciI family protein [Actinomycetota bacterium]MED5232004.1 YciI family protein [Actinomycetota bacterium]MED5394512.1 YciI family protein [Actinomycetota bacterium]MEE3353347.1 YciI family protein [Actinomycetota bacterium]
MHFVIHAIDRSDAGGLRGRTRPAHLDYLGGFEVIFGGPMIDDDGVMCGSLIVVQAEDREAAEAFAAGDPYALAGLFETVTITAMKPLLGV